MKWVFNDMILKQSLVGDKTQVKTDSAATKYEKSLYNGHKYKW